MCGRDEKMMDKNGFSLIELIIVIAIFGILLAIAALSGREWMERYRVEGQTKEMYADLMKARVSAMQRNRMFFVRLAQNQYAIYEDTFSSPDGNEVYDPGQDTLVTQKTLQYTFNSGYPASFDFTANGLLLSTNPTDTISVTSTANPLSDCIVISTTRILMGKMNGTNCATQ